MVIVIFFLLDQPPNSRRFNSERSRVQERGNGNGGGLCIRRRSSQGIYSRRPGARGPGVSRRQSRAAQLWVTQQGEGERERERKSRRRGILWAIGGRERLAVALSGGIG